MTLAPLDAVADRFGPVTTTFACCDTTFEVRARGLGASRAVERARETARRLESHLDAFDPASAVSTLNRSGRVDSPHVARLVRRAKHYRERTDGAFAIGHGRVEHAVKAHIGDADNPPPERFGEAATITVDGDRVTATAPVDLNGLAKGYVVDRAAEAVRGLARRGFVDGGGDLSPPTGPVAVENPFGDGKPLVVLDTDWAIATSGTTRRCRGDVDHIYDPAAGRLGAAQDAVTVVARRDCTEADALATALAALPTDRALALVDDWAGAEATLVRNGVVRRSEGFGDHVHRS